jgi:hypothetical protein
VLLLGHQSGSQPLIPDTKPVRSAKPQRPSCDWVFDPPPLFRTANSRRTSPFEAHIRPERPGTVSNKEANPSAPGISHLGAPAR